MVALRSVARGCLAFTYSSHSFHIRVMSTKYFGVSTFISIKTCIEMIEKSVFRVLKAKVHVIHGDVILHHVEKKGKKIYKS